MDEATSACSPSPLYRQFSQPHWESWLHILVNNAAYSVEDGFQALDANILDAAYAVNLRATALLSVEFAGRYPGGTGGRIINLTSGQFRGPMLGEIAYAATKGAIDALTITIKQAGSPWLLNMGRNAIRTRCCRGKIPKGILA